MEDIQDVSRNIQSALSEFASGPMSEVKDLTKQVRDNFLEANSAANIEITGEDKLAKMDGQLTGIKTGYEAIDNTLISLHTNLNGITDTTELGMEALDQQVSIQQRIATGKVEEARVTDDLADQQRNVLMTEQARAATPFESDAYKEYSEIIKEANRSIIEQQGHITGLQAQQVGLKSIHDGYLATIIKEVNAGKSINQITATRRQLQRNNLDLSAAQVDLIDQQKKELERLGPGMDDYIKKWGAANDAVMGSFDSIAGGISDTLGSLPLVGGLLKSHVEGPLKEAAEQSKKQWQGFTEGMQSSMAEGDSFATAMKKNIGGIGGAIGGMGKAIMGALLNPFTLVLVVVGALVFLLKSAWGEMSRLEGLSRDFRLQMGMGAEQVQGLGDRILEMEGRWKNMGIWAEKFYESAAAWSDVNATVDHATAAQIEFVAVLESATGIAAATTTGAMANLMKLGATAKGEAEGLAMEMKTLSQKHGVKYAQVMEDVSAAGEEALIFAKGSAKALALGAIHARRMGSSLSDAASSAESLLDFEGSINSEMQASSMFGRHISMNGLRQAAMAGDVNGMMKERFKIMDSLGGLENMSRWQQKALADAMGTSVGELMNMNKARETENMLQRAANAGDVEAKEILAKRAKLQVDEGKSELEKLKILHEKNKLLEAQKGIMDELKAEWHKITTVLLPIVKTLAPQLLDFIKSFTGETGEGTARMEKLQGAIGLVIDAVKLVAENWKGLLIGIGLAIVALKVIPGILSIIAALIKTSATAGAAGGGGGFLTSISKAINKLKTTKMIKAAAAMVILAGAVWITAKAFQEFGKVDWSNAWLGFAAMAGLVVMAKGLGKAHKSLMQGAFAIAILGASLVPFAFAMTLLKDVGWGEFALAAAGITLLGVAGALLGAFAPLTIAGAAALLLLSLAFIPLGYGLSLVTPLMEAWGKMVIGLATVLVPVMQSLIAALLKFAEVLGGFILGVLDRVIIGFKTMGDVIVNVAMAIASIVTSVGDAIASVITAIGDVITGFITSVAEGIAIVIDSVSGAINVMVDDITRLAKIDAGNLLKVAGALVAVGVAMAGFGVGAAVGAAASGAGNAIGAMGNAVAGVFGADTKELNKSPLQKILDFAKESESIILVSDKIGSLLDSFDRLAGMETILETAASALQTFGDALSSFGAGNATAGIGNAVGAMGNSLAGMFGADAPQDPIDQLMGFIDKLGSVDLNVESLEILSSLNLGGFLNNITDDFGDKIEMVSDGLGDFINVFESVKPTTITSIDKITGGLTKLLNGLSRSLPKIKTSDSKNLIKVADGLDEFFDAMDEVNTSKLKILPEIGVSMIPLIKDFSELPLSSISEDVSSIMNDLGDGVYHFFNELAPTDLTILPKLVEINAGITPFITNFATIPLSSIPEDVSSIMNNMGDGIFQFFDELAPTDLTILPHIVTIQQGMIPFLKAFAQAPIPSEGFDSILIDIGKGIEQFADYVNDGEGESIGKFFKATGSSFVKFVESISKLSGVGDISLIGQLKELQAVGHTLDEESAGKLKTFASAFVDAMNSFAGIQDPAVEALSAITSELYMLCDVIEKLDVDKLGGLQNINLGGVQTPIKIPARKSEQQIIEGTLGPKLMMTETADLHVTDVVGSSLPPSDPFTTPGSSLAEVFSTPLAKTQVQQVAATGTTPMATAFAEPVVIEKQIKETGMSSIGSYEVFTENLIKEMGDLSLDQYTEKLNSYVENNNQLIKMGIEGRAELDINKFVTENKYMKRMSQEIETEKTYEVENANMMQQSQISFDLATLTDLKNLISKPGGQHLQLNDMNKISSTFGINAEKMQNEMYLSDTTGSMNHDVFKNEILKMIYERENKLILNNTQNLPNQMQSNFEMMDSTSTQPTTPSLDSITQTPTSPTLEKISSAPIPQPAQTPIEEATPTTPTLAEIFSTPIPQPTPTPTSPTLEEISSAPIPQPAQTPIEEATPTTPTLAEIFSKSVTEPIAEELASTTAIPNVEESISTKLQTTSAESSTDMFTRIADFASNILPDPSKILDWFDFSEPTFEQNVTGDNDMGEFQSIYIRGESIFVDEIAKLKSPSAQTASGEQQEDSQKVVKKLDELIKLMQNGGISVNMDGRKVSKSVAKAHD